MTFIAANLIPMKIYQCFKFPTNALEVLLTNLGGHEITENINEADIAIGIPAPEAVRQSPTIKWVQMASAGYDSFDKPEVRTWLNERGIKVSNSSNIYLEPCAQHALTMMLALSRRLPQACANQSGPREWNQWQERKDTWLLKGQTVLLLSYGAIAKRLCEMLAPFHMNVIAVRRNVTGAEPIKAITENELNEYFPQADHVVNILPGGDDTLNYMDAAKFSLMRRGAIYYSIGRGTTTDQKAIAEALHSGHLSAAYLDVTSPEPLPSDHELWTVPNCYITPHTAGGHHDEFIRIVQQFLENLKRFENGEDLLDRVI